MPTENDGPDKINAGKIMSALTDMAECVGKGLDYVCSWSVMFTEMYVPFEPSLGEDGADPCDDEEAPCSQAWVRVSAVTPLAEESWAGPGGCAMALRLNIEVGVSRCLDIPEGAEAYPEEEIFLSAFQSARDMNAILCAAMGCEVWDRLEAGAWTPVGPMGGFYGGEWTFTADIYF